MAATVTRLPSGRFPAGVSGNPGGRLKVPRGLRELRALVHERGAELGRMLLDIASNDAEKAKDRVAAVKELLAWGYVSPQHAAEVLAQGDADGLAAAPLEERIVAVEALLADLKAEAKR